ncbi:MAG: L,D-transpeptidase [Anaerolineae bacterium]|nr:L,D-transpeptidase [Anaerolineae bacterium]
MKRIVRYLLIAALIAPIIAVTTDTTPAAALDFNPTVCAKDNAGKPLSKACEAMIAAFPTPPNVEGIDLDLATMNRYSFWKIGPNATDLYDSPGGTVVGQYPAGFNFVNAIDVSVDGWLRIEGGRWISRDAAKYSEPSIFHGVKINDGLKYPFAFVLDKSTIYTSEVPGGAASKNTKRWLKRYEVVNLFAEAVDADGWTWYMIGPNQWVKQTFLSVVLPTQAPKDADGKVVNGHWVAVDLYEQTLVAYEDDVPVFATLVASGVPKHDTQEGVFAVWAKLERDGMSGAAGAPEAYALQSVPWVMYFDGSYSLHGTYWHDLFGYRQSHGCVNLTISDASYLYKWFATAKPDKEGKIVNHVYVYSSGEYGSGVIRDK